MGLSELGSVQSRGCLTRDFLTLSRYARRAFAHMHPATARMVAVLMVLMVAGGAGPPDLPRAPSVALSQAAFARWS
jgi:hypothetical protein